MVLPVKSQDAEEDLFLLSLEELQEIEVTTVSRSKETAWDAPAAVTVVTQEQIRRMGATTVPDILRRVPGIHVARISNGLWSVSCRGWADQLSRQLLVLVNGRPIYQADIGGVDWENYNNLVPDIKQIEVIRGPGGTMWGANAVNGVINIITEGREVSAEPETRVSLGFGDYTRVRSHITHSDWVSETLNYRLSLGGFVNKNFPAAVETHDDTQGTRSALNVNWLPTDQDQIFFETAFMDNRAGQESTGADLQPFVQDLKNYNAHALIRWERQLDSDRGFSLQYFYDWFRFREEYTSRDNVSQEVEGEYFFKWGDRHKLRLGAGVRHVRIKEQTSPLRLPQRHIGRDMFYNAFISDEIALIPNKLDLVTGVKWEKSPYSGSAFLPNLRLSYRPNSDTTYWIGVSEAIHSPSQQETYGGIVVPQGLPFNGRPIFLGQRGLKDERMTAYEAGWRRRWTRSVATDLTLFYFDYHDLLDVVQDYQFPNLYLTADNVAEGEAYGFEFSLSWEPTDWYLLTANYSFLRFHKRLTTDDPNVSLTPTHLRSPRNMANLIQAFKVTDRTNLELAVRYVDCVPDSGNLDLAAYIQADASINWQWTERCRISLHGYNLLDASQPEASTGNFLGDNATEVPRAVYMQIDYQF